MQESQVWFAASIAEGLDVYNLTPSDLTLSGLHRKLNTHMVSINSYDLTLKNKYNKP